MPETMSFDLHFCLGHLIEKGGSDLHLKVPAPPVIRVDGQMRPVDGLAPMTPEETDRAMREMLHDADKLEEFATDGEVDFAYSIPGVARFRCNAFRQRGSVSLVILLTGTTGSGKSTTLAAMIDHINSTRRRHIVTVEDPLEFLHEDKKSIINQREVGMDTGSFKRALRRVLRQDPDVILIGEMRDEETVHTALSAAETGHLVFSTVHTVDAAETVNRLIDFFPPHMHNQVRAMIASTLKGAVSQRLIPTADGNGRIACCEVLRMTGRVRDMIMNPEETGKLPEVIAEGSFYGMQTFDQHLFEHLKHGRVEMDTAVQFASSPHDFKLLVAADGKRGTTMEDLTDAESRRSPMAA